MRRDGQVRIFAYCRGWEVGPRTHSIKAYDACVDDGEIIKNVYLMDSPHIVLSWQMKHGEKRYLELWVDKD